ncbi:MAG: universal stress protein [Anderseniella sp.]|jgi:universal stress protein F|nr:universal stress protein [Anderseniella sp.]
MFKKILVPVDLSHGELAGQMINVARQVGGKDAEIHIVHVVNDIPAYAAVEISSELLAKAKQATEQELQDIANSNGIKSKPDMRHGTPGSGILDAADDLGADLIVIGSHKPGLADYFLGSTAARVVRHAQCPVLVMR